ncbi:protein SSUH2 homolog isoform X2 [Argiope bruennichi]|uniref:protein SSUH2 homolog isoform X2 n=1 Tax=Argiope bruennichi TaxID=94029 RepID=UPI002494A219|nr:protein SSUH2 homolog isoform X2 [Argiope bruennichi]
MSVDIRRLSLPVIEYLKRPTLYSLRKIDDEPQKCSLPNIPEITEKEIREALMTEVMSHWCYGKAPARELTIVDVKHSISFQYLLETFTERRATCEITEPYTGGPWEKDEDGDPPDIYDVPATPPEYFKSYVYHQELPCSTEVFDCEECDGEGSYECPTCFGQGWEFCVYCRGNKWNPLYVDGGDFDCIKCDGSGERTCWDCNGDEDVDCKVCGGAGEMKTYTRLLVIWCNHVDDYIVEKGSALKGHRLRLATGINVCEEEDLTLMPLTHFPITAVSMASVELIKRHAKKYKDEKVLKQRHRVFIIPVATVRYQWKKHEGTFYVYGNERLVHFPDYPQKCCCCTLI